MFDMYLYNNFLYISQFRISKLQKLEKEKAMLLFQIQMTPAAVVIQRVTIQIVIASIKEANTKRVRSTVKSTRSIASIDETKMIMMAMMAMMMATVTIVIPDQKNERKKRRAKRRRLAVFSFSLSLIKKEKKEKKEVPLFMPQIPRIK